MFEKGRNTDQQTGFSLSSSLFGDIKKVAAQMNGRFIITWTVVNLIIPSPADRVADQITDTNLFIHRPEVKRRVDSQFFSIITHLCGLKMTRNYTHLTVASHTFGGSRLYVLVFFSSQMIIAHTMRNVNITHSPLHMAQSS